MSRGRKKPPTGRVRRTPAFVALGSYDEAEALYERALGMAMEVSDQGEIQTILNNQADLALTRGEPERAERLQEESLKIGREIGDRRGVATSYYNLGDAAQRMGKSSQARSLYQECLSVSREVGYTLGVVSALNGLGALALEQGLDADSLGYFRDALTTAMAASATPLALDVLVGIAAVLARGRERERSLELLGLSLSHPAAKKATKDKARLLCATQFPDVSPDPLVSPEREGPRKSLEEVVGELRGWWETGNRGGGE
jgi:tetratricopeptide (TPR) repeat protein